MLWRLTTERSRSTPGIVKLRGPPRQSRGVSYWALVGQELIFSHGTRDQAASEFARISKSGEVTITNQELPDAGRAVLDVFSAALAKPAIEPDHPRLLPLIVCPRQLDLHERPTDQIQTFFELLADLGLGRIRFLRANPVGAKFKHDGHMDVGRFKDLMDGGSGLVRLATQPRLMDGQETLKPDQILFAVMMTYDGGDEVAVNVECELTPDNYLAVAEAFTEAFGEDMRLVLDTGHHV